MRRHTTRVATASPKRRPRRRAGTDERIELLVDDGLDVGRQCGHGRRAEVLLEEAAVPGGIGGSAVASTCIGSP